MAEQVRIRPHWALRDAPVSPPQDVGMAKHDFISRSIPGKFIMAIGKKHLALIERSDARELRDRLNEFLER